MRSLRAERDEGETLVEVLMAVVIMGIAAVSIVGGIATSVLMSDIHHKQATAGAAVRDYAEKLENAIGAGGYKICGRPSDYTAAQVGYVATAGYTPAVTSVTYWEDTSTTPALSPPAFSGTCPTKANNVSGVDSGIQQVALKVSSSDGRAAETLNVVIRRPCADQSCS